MAPPQEAFTKKTELCLDGRIIRKSIYPTASGGYADVYEGFFDGRKVAIKVVRPFGSSGRKMEDEKLLRRLWREYVAWSCLSHRNILVCLGYSYDFSPGSYILPSLVSPWMENGTVTSYLYEHPDADRLKLLAGIADGLAYLHSREPVIVHGDLRAGNVLVSDQGVACLIDFGLSRVLEDIKGITTTTEIAGSVRWMSPELFENDAKVSMYSDIWAYGMTVLEVLSGERPYSTTKSDLVVLQHIRDGQYPSRPQNFEVFSDQVWDLCQRCWSLEPTSRPSMEMVASILMPPIKQKYDVLILKSLMQSSGWVAVSSSRNPDRTVHITPGHVLEHRDNRISNLRFSADGKYIAVGSWSIVEIYRTSTGVKTLTIKADDSASISTMCFSPDGKLLAIGDRDGRIMIGNTSDRTYKYISEGCDSAVRALEFSSDGHLLVSLSEWDGTLGIWDIETYKHRALRINLSSKRTPRIMAISPDGRLSAISLRDAHVYLWDVQRNILLERLTGRRADVVTNATFTPDGKGLSSWSSNGPARLWDLSPFLRHPKRNTPLELLGDASVGVTEGQGEKGSVCLAFLGPMEYPLRVSIPRDGKWVISASVNPGRLVRFWDSDTEPPMAELRFVHGLSAAVSVDLSPESGILATMDYKQDSVTLIHYSVGS